MSMFNKSTLHNVYRTHQKNYFKAIKDQFFDLSPSQLQSLYQSRVSFTENTALWTRWISDE